MKVLPSRIPGARRLATLLLSGPVTFAAPPLRMERAPSPALACVLLCDDIRQEVGGKATLLGIHPDHIALPKVPFVLPKTCFYIRFTRVTPADDRFSFALVTPSGTRTDILNDTPIRIPSGSTEGTFNVIVSPFEAKEVGTYKAIMTLRSAGVAREYVYRFRLSSAAVREDAIPEQAP